MIYILWGAGYIGKSIAKYCTECGCKPAYFVDSNSQLWGSLCEGIFVYNPEKIMTEKKKYCVIIACKEKGEIYQQLSAYGVAPNSIIKEGELWRILPDIWRKTMKYNSSKHAYEQKNSASKVVFDLQRGLILGGVEAWTFQMSELFRVHGIKAEYLTLDSSEKLIENEKAYVIEIDFANNIEMKKRIENVAEEIWKREPCNIIANFTGMIFCGMCYAKHIRPKNSHFITVIHNDEDTYYDAYVCMERYIDFCIVISMRMQKRLLERGFPKEKIRIMPWKVACENKLMRQYSTPKCPLFIGYAGRITMKQKRLDLCLRIAQELNERQINFTFQIAGEGDYLDELLTQVRKLNLQKKIQFHGYIPRNEIPDFWQRQDIMVSCSDWEGHSITQVEAMAAGAVPIVTDVSGARDDITDGENGFVVEVGAVDQIVEKICFLYEHRELLPVMGGKAHETIKVKCDAADMEEFWRSILM